VLLGNLERTGVMLKSMVVLFLVTLIPGLELRASIPVGILGGKWLAEPMAWPAVVVTCTVANILLGWGVFWLLDPVLKLLRLMPWFERLVMRYIERARAKLKPQVDKYGAIGLAIFIGIPLSLTGAYTGAAGAFALGMERRQFMLANVVGVLIAAVLVTIITLLIRAGINLPIFDILIKA